MNDTIFQSGREKMWHEICLRTLLLKWSKIIISPCIPPLAFSHYPLTQKQYQEEIDILNQDQCEMLYQFSIIIPITHIKTKNGMSAQNLHCNCLLREIIFRTIALMKDVH